MKIALVGKARSGKDTVTDYLVENYGFKEYKFSKGIHDVIHLVRGPATTKGKQRRELQAVGQGLREALGEDIWIDYTMRQILQDRHTDIVISDCRQKNEADRLRAEGYILVLVDAEEEVRIKRMIAAGDHFTKEDLNHATEHIDFETDEVLTNNGTVLDLYQQIEDLMLSYELEDESALEEHEDDEN